MRQAMPQNGSRRQDWRAAQLVLDLLADHGWSPADLERVSLPAGHPDRAVSKRTVYRVLYDGHVPTHPVQFEIAACFGLLPSHIWGRVPIPADYAPNPAQWRMAA